MERKFVRYEHEFLYVRAYDQQGGIGSASRRDTDGILLTSDLLFAANKSVPRTEIVGVSRKSQQLYLLAFCARYLDIFKFRSWYSTFFKAFYILSTAMIVHTLSYTEPARSTYEAHHDSLGRGSLIAIPLLLAVIAYFVGSGRLGFIDTEFSEWNLTINAERVEWKEIMFTFSILLESVAMLPQLHIFRKQRNLQVEVQISIGLFGSYRLFYIGHWIDRAFKESYYMPHPVIHLALLAQVVSYADFWRIQAIRCSHVFCCIKTSQRAFHAPGLKSNQVEGLASECDDASDEEFYDEGNKEQQSFIYEGTVYGGEDGCEGGRRERGVDPPASTIAPQHTKHRRRQQRKLRLS